MNRPSLDMSKKAKAAGRAYGRHLLAAVVTDLRDEIVAQMDPGPPRTGRIYPMPNGGGTYQASAPGEPPAIREGNYAAAWQTSPVVERGHIMIAAAVNDRKTEDGKHFIGDLLENGTQRITPSEDGDTTIEHMAPRPHIAPAVDIVAERYGAKLRRR